MFSSEVSPNLSQAENKSANVSNLSARESRLKKFDSDKSSFESRLGQHYKKTGASEKEEDTSGPLSEELEEGCIEVTQLAVVSDNSERLEGQKIIKVPSDLGVLDIASQFKVSEDLAKRLNLIEDKKSSKILEGFSDEMSLSQQKELSNQGLKNSGVEVVSLNSTNSNEAWEKMLKLKSPQDKATLDDEILNNLATKEDAGHKDTKVKPDLIKVGNKNSLSFDVLAHHEPQAIKSDINSISSKVNGVVETSSLSGQMANEIRGLYNKQGGRVLVELKGHENETVAISVKVTNGIADVRIVTPSREIEKIISQGVFDLKRSLESSEVQDANIRVDLANKEELSSFLNDHLSQKEHEEDQTYSDELRDLKIPSVDIKNFDSKLAFLESVPEYSQRIQVVA